MKRGILKDFAALWNLAFQLVDFCLVFVAGYVAGWVYLGPETVNSLLYSQLILLVALISLYLFNQLDLYRAWRTATLGQELLLLLRAWVLVQIGLLAYFFFSKAGIQYSRVWAVAWGASGFTLLASCRGLLRLFLRRMRAMGLNQKKALLIGNKQLVDKLNDKLQRASWMGVAVKEAVYQDSVLLQRNTDNGLLDQLIQKVEQEGIEQVWITLPLKDEILVNQLVESLTFSAVEVRYVPDLASQKLFSHSLSEVEGLPVFNLSGTPIDGAGHLVKAIEDKVLSLLILTLISPLMLVIAVAVKLSSQGPVFFKQLRHGWGGKKFKVLKFRTMTVHKEEGQITQATKNDARITPVGRFLRRTSLDELPQFFNVLAGSMSIVGPRPHAVEHNEFYKHQIERYMLRHRVKPGITGWAQINGFRGETDTVDKMKSRVEYDLYYIEHWSLWFDLKIIALTFFKGFFGKNAY